MILSVLRKAGVAGSPLDIGKTRAKEILRIIKAGWEKALEYPDVGREAREVELNGRLLDGMRTAINEKVVRSHRKISVLPGTESRSSDKSAAADGLTDISIHLRDIRERQHSHGPHAVIECKRIAGNRSDLCRLYVKEGIDDRFISGKYALNHEVSFMAGYLVAGNVCEAVAGINAYLRRNDRAKENLVTSTLFNARWTRTSTHIRTRNNRSLALHHAFLEFNAT